MIDQKAYYICYTCNNQRQYLTGFQSDLYGDYLTGAFSTMPSAAMPFSLKAADRIADKLQKELVHTRLCVASFFNQDMVQEVVF